MEVSSALSLINDGVVYKPGWTIEAQDYSAKFEGAITVTITYPARNANRDQAPEGYPTDVPCGAHATFIILAGGMKNMEDLHRQVIQNLIKIEIHEMREFYRIRPTFWAPFHPHRMDGMERWGNIEEDLTFGVAG